MNQVDQNFEQTVKSIPIAKKTDRPAWKKLIYIIPALTFFGLITTLLLVSRSQKQPQIATQAPEPSPTPSGPQPQIVVDLEASKTNLQNLNLDQPELAPPLLDLKVSF